MATLQETARQGTEGAGTEQGRLLWRCRRGMKELDVMLERFARGALPGAAPEERVLFEQLLALPDSQLARYLLAGETPAEARLARLVDHIRDLCRPGGVPAVFCP
ncbi:MAG: succinate dehydrogenase assembly factor 2 [Steroidobacteraceae bacterium]